MTPFQLIDTASRHQVYLEGLKTGTVQDFNQVFDYIDKATNDVLRALQVDKLSDLKRSEFEQLLRDLREQHTVLLDKQIDSLLADFPPLAFYETRFEARALKSVMTKQGQAKVETPPAAKAYREAKKRPVQATGELLEPLIRDFGERAVSLVNNAVRLGYEQGRTVPQIVKAIRGTPDFKYKDGVTEVTRRHASTVIRTAVQHVANTARQVTWEENSDLVIGLEWVSTLDGRTSAQCRSLDGKKFKLDEGPRPPIHPNCRSTTAPDLDPAFDFLDEGATRSALNGPVDANQTYYDWLKNQDPAFQDSVIGKERGKLLRDGGLTSKQFATLQLDKNWQPLTLDEMKQLEPLAFQRAGLSSAPKPVPTPPPAQPAVTGETKWNALTASINEIAQGFPDLANEAKVSREEFNSFAASLGRRVDPAGLAPDVRAKYDSLLEKSAKAIRIATERGTPENIAASRSVIHDVLAKTTNAKVEQQTFVFFPLSETATKSLAEASEFLNKIVADKFKKEAITVVASTEAEGSFYMKDKKELALRPSAPGKIAAHELAHHFEFQTGQYQRLVDFIVKRKGSELSYKRGSIDLFKDEWIERGGADYTSRVYFQQGATEVVSTGAERLFENPLDFYQRDPEHFEMTVRTLLDLW